MSVSKKILSTATPRFTLIFILFIASSWCVAEQQVVTNDSRETVVHDNETWEFSSTDKYATTTDGKQVQLKEDGRWRYIESAPAITTSQYENTPVNSNNLTVQSLEASSNLVNVQLKEAFVEQFSERAGAQSKNVRTHSYINFLLNVALSTDTEHSLSLNNLGPQDVVVTDSRKVRYDVLSVEYDLAELQSGDSSQLKIITDGAPNSIFGGRDIYLHIKPTAEGIPSPVDIELNYRDLDKVNIPNKY